MRKLTEKEQLRLFFFCDPQCGFMPLPVIVTCNEADNAMHKICVA